MPKPPLPVGVARVAAEGTNAGTTWANVYHFAVGTWDPAHLEDAAILVEDAVQHIYDTVFTYDGFPPTWTFDVVKVSFRDAVDSMYRSQRIVGAVGTESTDSEPAQVSRLVNWFSDDPRKGGKARTYIPATPEFWFADSAHLKGTIVASINANIATWIAGLGSASHGTASGLSFLELSFVNGKADRTDAHAYTIRGGALSNIYATQRRRVDRLRS